MIYEIKNFKCKNTYILIKNTLKIEHFCIIVIATIDTLVF